MCGIAGIIDLAGRPVERPLLGAMCARLAHRGPDDDGYHLNCVAGLGHRRLSIIDLSSGHQPLANEDGTVWVSFNGEIYNFAELRADLEKRGHRFATRTDTEVIVHAYEEYGDDCVEHFRGMFAFAVWDAARRTLLLARDRVGKKPLFYTRAGGQFLFASELQALVAHPAVARELDPFALDSYLTYGYVPGPRTIYRDVCKLPPAHRLTLRLAPDAAAPPEAKVDCYWRLRYGPKFQGTEEEAAEGLLEVLTEAVRLRLIADVPLGALLSGGVDSSLIVALMSRLSSTPVKTFSIGFEDQQFNELPHARLVARHCGTDHHEFIVRPSALEVLPTLVRHYGEPYADSSAIPSYYVAQLTRRHVKVALNGDGGDECFAGYERYLGGLLAERYRKVPALLRRGIGCLAGLIPGSLPRRSRLRQARRFLQAAALPAPEGYLRWVTYCTPEQKRALYTPEFRARLAGHDAGAWLLGEFDAARADGAGPLDALLALDVRTYLPCDLLVKMDIATMANSLEARSPLLDHAVMEFAARLPASFKIHGRTQKYLLKKAAAKLLPAPILRRRKMGFGVPVGDWMRGALRPMLEDLLLSPQARTRSYFQPGRLRRLVAEHVGGQDYTYQLWAVLWLELWHREFLP
jgi:asparagine synthase (glutamine-hydrolysing)